MATILTDARRPAPSGDAEADISSSRIAGNIDFGTRVRHWDRPTTCDVSAFIWSQNLAALQINFA
jgi:hypothetical protein